MPEGALTVDANQLASGLKQINSRFGVRALQLLKRY